MPQYMMPIVAGTRENRVCKYDADLAPFGVTTLRYGDQDQCVVESPCDAATDAAVSANPDVVRLPDALDTVVSTAELPGLQAYLEAARIPADWIGVHHTWREVVRGVLQIFLFAQRYGGEAHGPPLFDGVVTLDAPLSAIPAATRHALRKAAELQGYDTAVLRPHVSLRRVLRALSLQWGQAPIIIGSLQV
jgi:hypothetical protein